jgi:hypothetical protein
VVRGIAKLFQSESFQVDGVRRRMSAAAVRSLEEHGALLCALANTDDAPTLICINE